MRCAIDDLDRYNSPKGNNSPSGVANAEGTPNSTMARREPSRSANRGATTKRRGSVESSPSRPLPDGCSEPPGPSDPSA
jgi:hypothetical protein